MQRVTAILEMCGRPLVYDGGIAHVVSCVVARDRRAGSSALIGRVVGETYNWPRYCSPSHSSTRQHEFRGSRDFGDTVVDYWSA
jgi:hypothetical protein